MVSVGILNVPYILGKPVYMFSPGLGVESEVAQLCPTLRYPMDCSPPGSSVHGIFQERILEWVVISFSRGSSQPRDWTQVSLIAGRCFNLWATREAPYSGILHACMCAKSLYSCRIHDPVDCQALLFMGFSRQEYWSGLPFPSPMQESEKWKWSRSVVSDSSRPHGLQPTRLLCPWDFPGKSTGVGCHCLLQ